MLDHNRKAFDTQHREFIQALMQKTMLEVEKANLQARLTAIMARVEEIQKRERLW